LQLGLTGIRQRSRIVARNRGESAVLHPRVPRRTLANQLGIALFLIGLPLIPARAQLPPPELLPPVVFECWPDVRLFQSFTAGTTDYCRTHLRYVPGALECYQLFDQVCSVYLPASGEWTELRRPRSRVPIPCPDGPEPPMCRRLDLQ
jgi:hypothetical protein